MGERLRARAPPCDANVGPEAIETWLDDIRDQGFQVHLLPYYGTWLWEPLHAMSWVYVALRSIQISRFGTVLSCESRRPWYVVRGKGTPNSVVNRFLPKST